MAKKSAQPRAELATKPTLRSPKAEVMTETERTRDRGYVLMCAGDCGREAAPRSCYCHSCEDAID